MNFFENTWKMNLSPWNCFLFCFVLFCFLLFFFFVFCFFFSGWGRTSSSKKSNILQEAKMPVVDYDTCVAGNINLTYASVDDETMLCAGYGGDSVVSFHFLYSFFFFYDKNYPFQKHVKSEHDFGPVWNCAMAVEIELDHRKIKLEIRQASQKQSFQVRIYLK